MVPSTFTLSDFLVAALAPAIPMAEQPISLTERAARVRGPPQKRSHRGCSTVRAVWREGDSPMNIKTPGSFTHHRFLRSVAALSLLTGLGCLVPVHAWQSADSATSRGEHGSARVIDLLIRKEQIKVAGRDTT